MRPSSTRAATTPSISPSDDDHVGPGSHGVSFDSGLAMRHHAMGRCDSFARSLRGAGSFRSTMPSEGNLAGCDRPRTRRRADLPGERPEPRVTRERVQARADESAGTVTVASALRETRLQEGELRPGQRAMLDEDVEPVLVVAVGKPRQQQRVPLAQRLRAILARHTRGSGTAPTLGSMVQGAQVLIGELAPRVGGGEHPGDHLRERGLPLAYPPVAVASPPVAGLPPQQPTGSALAELRESMVLPDRGPQRGRRVRDHEASRLHRILGAKVVAALRLAGQVDQRSIARTALSTSSPPRASRMLVACPLNTCRHRVRSLGETRRSPAK